MFAGVIESKSHEGGFLVSFTGSSPALESIIINAETGIYIGKVDAVLGNTNSPLAHVAHVDRKLDLDSLVGINVGIRAKKQREERRERDSDRGQRGNDRGYQSQDRQGGRFERNDRGQDNNRNGGDWDCPKCQNNNFAFRTECNRCGEARGAGGAGGGRSPRQDDRRDGNQGYQSRDRQGGRFERNDRGQDNNRNGGDWDCPKCQNNNFAFRTECNRCGDARGAGGGRGPRQDDRRGGNQGYQSRDRQGGRFEQNDRGQNNRNGGDWDCPKCRNNNFAFRTECNSCGLPRSGGNDRNGGNDRRGGNDRYGGNDRRGGNDRGRETKVYTDNDWDCPKCQNSNFAFRQECNRCQAPRSGAGGGGGGGGGRSQRRDDGGRPPRRDSGGRPPQRDDRRAPRRDDGGRPPRRDDGGRPPQRDDRSRAPRSDDGGRPPQRDDGARPPRHEGGRQPRRDGRDRRSDGGGYQSGDSYGQDRAPERKSREPRNFRKSQGNGPGHAHNRPPKPLINPDRDD